MKYKSWPIDKLIIYEKNPRKNDHAVGEMAKALKAFGFRVPVLIKADGNVIDGHLRLKAARAAGITEIPVLIADDMTDEQIKAFRISVNRMAELAEWDMGLLEKELEEMKALDIDLDLTGLDVDFIDQLVGNDRQGLTDEDEIPEPPKEPITKPGDLWIMGEHRLLCGDAAKLDDCLKLGAENKVGLMATDPPYGVSYANDERPNPGVAKPRVAKPRVAKDTLRDQDLQKFLESVFKIASEIILAKNAAWYLWHAHLTQGFFAAAAAAADVLLHRQIIWVKSNMLLTRGQYHWKHEPCFMGWIKGNPPPDYGRGKGERDQTTVWSIKSVRQSERKEFNLSTPKPVELFEIPIIKHLRMGESCYEPFAGSGPQYIAAEKTRRICFGMDIDPGCCDVTVKRWERFTGKKARLAEEGE